MVKGRPSCVRAGKSVISVTVAWAAADGFSGRSTAVAPPSALDGAPPIGVGSKVVQPTSFRATSAHWWAWLEKTVRVSPVFPVAQPDTTLDGTPTDRARTTKALLNWPAVPSRLSKRNQSTGSRPAGSVADWGVAKA